MIFGTIYALYVNKITKNGRNEEELRQVLEWLTWYDSETVLKAMDDNKLTIKDFFTEATMNKNSSLITGTVCGVKVHEIYDPLYRNTRYMDMLAEELATGKPIEKIQRGGTEATTKQVKEKKRKRPVQNSAIEEKKANSTKRPRRSTHNRS